MKKMIDRCVRDELGEAHDFSAPGLACVGEFLTRDKYKQLAGY